MELIYAANIADIFFIHHTDMNYWHVTYVSLIYHWLIKASVWL